MNGAEQIPIAEPAQPVNNFVYLLQAGGITGLVLIAMGIVFTGWGLLNLRRRPSHFSLVLQATASLLPATIALVCVCVAYTKFVEMASSEQPPKPGDFARIVSFGLASGIWGPLATVIPAALGIFSLSRVIPRDGSAEQI